MHRVKEFLYWIPDSLGMPAWLRWWFHYSPFLLGIDFGFNIVCLALGPVIWIELFNLTANVVWLFVYIVLSNRLRRIIALEEARAEVLLKRLGPIGLQAIKDRRAS